MVSRPPTVRRPGNLSRWVVTESQDLEQEISGMSIDVSEAPANAQSNAVEIAQATPPPLVEGNTQENLTVPFADAEPRDTNKVYVRRVKPPRPARGAKRNYKKSFEVKFGVIKSKKKNEDGWDLAHCCLCKIGKKPIENGSVRKSHLENHFETEHGGAKNFSPKNIEDAVTIYKLRLKEEERNTLEHKGFVTKNDLDKVQLLLTDLLVRVKAPRRYGEILLKPGIQIVARELFGEHEEKTVSQIVLNRTDVGKTIGILSSDIRNQVIEMIKQSELPCSIQIDETTDVGKCAQVMIFVRWLHKDKDGQYRIMQNFLLCHQLPLSASSEEITRLFINFIEDHGLSIMDIGSVCADGAKKMQGDTSGVKALLEDMNPNLKFTNCYVHKFSLLCKTPLPPSLREVKKVVIEVVNFIRVRRTIFNLFKAFCKEREAPFLNLLFYNHVRWLSLKLCLVRLMVMFDHVRDFLHEQKHPLAYHFDSSVFKVRLAYLTDIHVHMSDVNTYLQGKNMIIPTAIDKIVQFKQDILAQSNCVKENVFLDFTHLSSQLEKVGNKRTRGNETAEQIVKKDILQHLQAIQNNVKTRFTYENPVTKKKKDLLKYKKWLKDPFADDALEENMPPYVKRDLIHMRAKPEIKKLYDQRESTEQFWCNMMHSYPNIAKVALRKILPYATTVMVERGFSGLNDLKTNNRQRLQTMAQETRVCLSEVRPRFEEIVASKNAN